MGGIPETCNDPFPLTEAECLMAIKPQHHSTSLNANTNILLSTPLRDFQG